MTETTCSMSGSLPTLANSSQIKCTGRAREPPGSASALSQSMFTVCHSVMASMKLKVEDVSELTTKTARLPPASPSFESSSSSWSVRLRSCGTEKGMSRVLQLMRMPFMVLPAASLKAL